MTRLLLSAALAAALSAPGFAAETLTVNVTGAGARGDLHASLYDEAGYRRAAPVMVAKTKPQDRTGTFSFAVPAPGRYAIRVFQDQDRNGKASYDGVGIGEPIGYSNGAGSRTRRPAFETASVEVPAGGTTVEIELK